MPICQNVLATAILDQENLFMLAPPLFCYNNLPPGDIME